VSVFKGLDVWERRGGGQPRGFRWRCRDTEWRRKFAAPACERERSIQLSNHALPTLEPINGCVANRHLITDDASQHWAEQTVVNLLLHRIQFVLVGPEVPTNEIVNQHPRII
jgi:hypothetical protein